MATHEPPHDSDAEVALLGACLLSPEAAAVAIDTVRPEDFYVPRHRMIFEAMLRLVKKHLPVDTSTVASEMAKAGELEAVGGHQVLVDAASYVPAPSNVRGYARPITETAVLRRLLGAAREIATAAVSGGPLDDIIASADRAMLNATTIRQKSEPVHISKAVDLAFDDIIEASANGGATHGVTTGLSDLDRLLAGLHDGNLVVVGARPSLGKTSLALLMSLAAARSNDKAVLLFSLEMNIRELGNRWIGSEGRYDARKLRSSGASGSTLNEIGAIVAGFSSVPLWIEESRRLRISEITSRARRFALKRPLGLVVVDYLTLVQPDGHHQNENSAMTEISRGLKLLAGDLDCPVVACSQLNRGPEERADKRPELRDLRASGSIEQDADVVMFLYRDDYYDRGSKDPGVAEVIIAKNRNGPTGRVYLSWNGPSMLFSDYKREQNGHVPEPLFSSPRRRRTGR